MPRSSLLLDEFLSTLRRNHTPLVVVFIVNQLKPPAVFRADTEALPLRAAPGIFNFAYYQPSALPVQSKRPSGIIIPRMAFDRGG